MPTRKITASPVKVTGRAPDGQQFESFLEEDFFVLLRFNSDVESWESNPVTIDWVDQAGKKRSYTPDVLVRMRPKDPSSPPIHILCEIKPNLDGAQERPASRLPRSEDPAENKMKWAAASAYAKRLGWTFRVYYESEIRHNRLWNAKFLLRFKERRVMDDRYEVLLAALRERKRMTLAEWVRPFSKTIEERARYLPTCYQLLADGQARTDLSTIISLESVVEWVE